VRVLERRGLVLLLCVALDRTCIANPDMAQAMQMDDAVRLGKVWFDQLEWRTAARPNEAAWQGEAWYGGDSNKAWVRSEGDAYSGRAQDARAELFCDHVVARWWSLQAGVRDDFGVGPARGWAALGIRGLAPQGVDVEATIYAGAAARTAARLKVEYELLFTQRLVLQPEIEMNLYGKADPARDIASGLSALEVGLRLRYEVRREVAPYAGVVWAKHRGVAGDFLRASGADFEEVRVAVGLRVWL
jgi:copper resistance protein B